MSITRRYFKFLAHKLKEIGKFTISPLAWSTSTCPDLKASNFKNDICLPCVICQCTICCCKLPIACVGSAISIPIGGSTALVFATIGGISLTFTLAADGVKSCYKSQSASTPLSDSSCKKTTFEYPTTNIKTNKNKDKNKNKNNDKNKYEDEELIKEKIKERIKENYVNRNKLKEDYINSMKINTIN